MLKEVVRSVLTIYRPIFDALDILTSTKEKIKRKLPLTKDKAKVLAEKYRHRAVKYQKIYTEKKRLMKEDISMIRFKEMSESEPGRIEFIDLTKIPRYCIELDDETKEKLTSILNEANIKYKSELSEAGWVYRFVISKSKKNIENINALLVK